METAATTTVPGFPEVDAREVHEALDAIVLDLNRSFGDRITSRVLMGMSLGAFHTLYIAAAEGSRESALVPFDRYVALYPPVRLRHGMEELDAFFNIPLSFPEEEREERVTAILQKAIAASTDKDLKPGVPIPLSEQEAEFLIGLGFRLTLHDMIWVSQERYDQGVLKTRRSTMRRYAANREILEFSFIEYLYAFALPYYQARDPSIRTVDDLFRRSELASIADDLAATGKVRVFANENDFLVTDEDVAWLTGLLGEKAVTFYPSGGHMGNLYLPEVQEDVMASLADLP